MLSCSLAARRSDKHAGTLSRWPPAAAAALLHTRAPLRELPGSSLSLSGLILESDVASYGIELSERALQEFLRHSLPKIVLTLYD